ncbi:MAG: hypothetical protein FJW47_00060 [Actinobacteria bacterium]|nr:hypothetical protein [Actinomycetota bacterium]
MNESSQDQIIQLAYTRWLIEFRPSKLATGELFKFDVIGDVVEMESNSPNTIWSEVWDFASRKPVIRSGALDHHCGGVSWYVTEIPWHRETLVYEVPETLTFKAGMAVWSEFWSMDTSR